MIEQEIVTNGGMRTIVGSHHWGLCEDAATFGEQDLEALQATSHREGRAWLDEPCLLRAGQASFHHALTFHGSGPNLSAEPRLSIVIHMMPADCGFTQHGRHHPNADLLGPYVREGDRFTGPYFPRIWPPGPTQRRWCPHYLTKSSPRTHSSRGG